MFCSQLKKGKLHGCIDVGLSVMSIKKKAMCIDLDTEDNIYHLKVTPGAHIINRSFVDLNMSQCRLWDVYVSRKCINAYMVSLSFTVSVRRQSQPLFCSNLTLCHPGEVSGAVWGVGVKAASSPRVSTEWDCHVSPREAPLPPPRLVLPLPQWLPEKSKLLVCRKPF